MRDGKIFKLIQNGRDKCLLEDWENDLKDCMEWMENIVTNMLEEYENQKTYTDCEEYRREGAVSVLEELLETIKGN